MRGKRKRCELGRLLPSLTEARRGWGTVRSDCEACPSLGSLARTGWPLTSHAQGLIQTSE